MLLGRKALVTGGSRGIGRAIALAFAAAGADVAIFFARQQAAAEEVVAAIEEQGRSALAYAVNVAHKAEVQAAMRELLGQWGHLDIVVNNAGIVKDGPLLRLAEEDLAEVLEVNLNGAFHVTQAALRPMLKRRFGRIINLSSVVGLRGNAGQSNYAAAKAGLLGFTRALAREVASRSVTVNAIAPGYITTDMTAQLTLEQQSALCASIPLGRQGTADEVAAAAVFLASEAAGYITGHTLSIDGGLAMG